MVLSTNAGHIFYHKGLRKCTHSIQFWSVKEQQKKCSSWLILPNLVLEQSPGRHRLTCVAKRGTEGSSQRELPGSTHKLEKGCRDSLGTKILWALNHIKSNQLCIICFFFLIRKNNLVNRSQEVRVNKQQSTA